MFYDRVACLLKPELDHQVNLSIFKPPGLENACQQVTYNRDIQLQGETRGEPRAPGQSFRLWVAGWGRPDGLGGLLIFSLGQKLASAGFGAKAQIKDFVLCIQTLKTQWS